MLARLRDKHLHTWLPSFLLQQLGRLRSRKETKQRHVLFAFCDHYEPLWGQATLEVGEARVRFWAEAYPRLAESFRDADGVSPKHSFFYPADQYHPRLLEPLTSLVRAGHGEVELHLHHDGDTRDTLREKLLEGLDKIGSHGHFSRTIDGRIRYAFIHGDWALANSCFGRNCGVDDELMLLFETGCYADFTFPSAPDESQPGMINQIYWPIGDLRRARGHHQGRRARVGEEFGDRLLMIEGPLALLPRLSRVPLCLENAAVTAKNPGTPSRLAAWITQDIHVQGRDEWVFVKVHTHGAPEKEAASLLGQPGRAMHRALATHYNDGARWKLHYVSAREMYNIAMAAMAGETGNPHDFRNYRLRPPPL